MMDLALVPALVAELVASRHWALALLSDYLLLALETENSQAPLKLMSEKTSGCYPREFLFNPQPQRIEAFVG